MARTKSRKESEYYQDAKRIVVWMGSNMVAKGFDIAFIQDRLKPEFNEYEHWYLLWLDPKTRTQEITANKNQAKKKFDETFSIAIEMIKSNPLVTDAERLNLNIAIAKGGGGQEAGPPDTFPVFSIKKQKATAPGRLVLVCKDFGKKLAGRPPHVSQVEYMYLIADEFVTTVEELKERGISTKSPIVIHRPGAERGKKCSIAGRWISNGGKPGDWGPVDGFIIP